MEDQDELCLLVPPHPQHLRAVRLVAAEAGGRAGFDVSELDDLRIAVDELCHALMETSERRLLVRVEVCPGRVVVRGSARRQPGGPAPELPGVTELIVDAVSSRYALDHDDDMMSFVLVKQAAGTGR